MADLMMLLSFGWKYSAVVKHFIASSKCPSFFATLPIMKCTDDSRGAKFFTILSSSNAYSHNIHMRRHSQPMAHKKTHLFEAMEGNQDVCTLETSLWVEWLQIAGNCQRLERLIELACSVLHHPQEAVE